MVVFKIIQNLVLLEEIQNHIKAQGLRAIDGLKQETVS